MVISATVIQRKISSKSIGISSSMIIDLFGYIPVLKVNNIASLLPTVPTILLELLQPDQQHP